MIIHNVTYSIEEDIHERWVQWMKEEHIPAMLETGKFSKALMTRVISKEGQDNITYSVQYTANDEQALQLYYQEDEERLREKEAPFKGKSLSFQVELKIVSEQ